MLGFSASKLDVSPRALLLDMDGLLVDSEPLWFEVERAFAATRGADFTHAQGVACVGRGIAKTLAFMHETFGFAVDVERDAAEIVDLFVARVDGLALKPGAAELVAATRGRMKMALASSSSRRLIAAVVARFDLASSLDAIVSGDDVAHQKPAPDIFLLAAAELGVPADACAVLEDSLAGATAGRAAGAYVIAVPEGDPTGRGFEAVAHAILPDLHQARDLLRL
jgi:mannitol-1-/sugar-/sorbitol-6-/2-deoxyglucose-6-phosphatase